MTLAAEFERLCREPSDINEHLPVLHALVLELNARHVIELGTRSGVSTVAFLYALETTGGTLTSVDIDDAPPIAPQPNWTFVRGDDRHPSVYTQLQPADIVFIDTSHHYGHTVTELNMYRWLVKPGGRIVLHDTELAWPEGASRVDGPYPVKRAVEEFCADTGYRWASLPNNNGLGIVEIP